MPPGPANRYPHAGPEDRHHFALWPSGVGRRRLGSALALEDLGDKGKAAPSADKKIKIDGASTKRLRADFDDLKRAMDPVERSAYELQNRLDLLNRALKQGAIGQSEYARVAGQARTLHEAPAASFRKVETGTKLAAYQITNLGYQIQDVAVQLAGGQNPFLILIQQGPQAAGAVGGFGTLMRLMVRLPLPSANYSPSAGRRRWW